MRRLDAVSPKRKTQTLALKTFADTGTVTCIGDLQRRRGTFFFSSGGAASICNTVCRYDEASSLIPDARPQNLPHLADRAREPHVRKGSGTRRA